MKSTCVLLLLLACTTSGQEKDILGSWAGPLKVGKVELRQVLHVKKAKSGGFLATMDSVDQSAFGLRVDTLEFDGVNVTATLKRLDAVYEGKLSKSRDRIKGTWKQRGVQMPLELVKTDAPPGPRVRPQEPKPPFPYESEEVTFVSPNSGSPFRLAGTLAIPEGKGPHPAAIFITGSGAQDRDETILGHRPFLLLADFLARRGVASLRVDDRGVGSSGGSMALATTRDFAGDTEAAIRFLLGRDEIDGSRIGLIGHSEGGLVAPMVAVGNEPVAFIVLLAAPGVSGEEILYEQVAAISQASGVPAEAIRRNRDGQRRLFGVLREEPDNKKARKRMEVVVQESLDAMSEGERKGLDLKTLVRQQVDPLLNPWFRFFLAFDPEETLRKVKCPVLALWGEKDLQVLPTQNIPEVVAALAGGECRDYAMIQLQGLNHLFQTCSTGTHYEYGEIEETMASIVPETVTRWILDRFGGKAEDGK